MAKIPKVNERNEVVGETTITEAREQGWPRRVTRVLVFDEEHNLLLQKRSMSVHTYPGLWDCSGGHVNVGESYAEAGEREISEEVGIDATVEERSEPILFEHTFSVACVGHIARAKHITLNEEVDAVKWVSIEDFDRLIAESSADYTPWLLHAWQTFRDKLTA